MSERKDDDDADYGYGGCNRCGGTGTIITCWDDICHGDGECMHGDGEIDCPDCGGNL